MTIPQEPPDDLPEEPGIEIPPEGPTPDMPPAESPPEYPQTEEPDWRAPGSTEDYGAPMRMPSDNPDVETEL